MNITPDDHGHFNLTEDSFSYDNYFTIAINK